MIVRLRKSVNEFRKRKRGSRDELGLYGLTGSTNATEGPKAVFSC